MDIRRWLEQRDLGKYAEVLIENEVQFGDLPELTEDDFSELGFPLGPRRRILRAIRELDPTEFSDSPPPSDSDSQIGDESHAAWTRHPDDRRPVTLLFADLTGSTALTEQLDPEDTHDILYGAVQRMGDAVEAHRGTVCRFMGDGLMAMFGVPTAFESHAQQACLGALALQEAIEIYSAEVERDFGAKLQARVGLHSGEIVALQVGEGERREWDASGPAVPIAARLEQSAQPGTVQMTESTFDLVRPYFEGTAMEPVRVKGIRTPLSVIRLEHAVESEPTAAPVQIAPFVGRRTETGQMTAALESCLEEGSGQTLFVRGEAGVGKSRLVQEVLQTADSLGFMHHSALVLDFGAGKDQDPISSLTQSLLRLPKHPTEEQGINVVERAFADEVVNETEAAFVFDLLDVSKPPQVALEFEAMDPERRRRGRRDVFRDIVARLSRQRPTLIVVEDVHYADEITLDYLRELMRATFDVPLVLLMTTRPSQDPLSADWQSIAADAPITFVNLRALRDSESQRLAAYFEGLPPSTVAACIERSDGNPLFLIELLRAGQRGLLDSMPTSVQTIAVARMDELQPDDKEAIQAAAVLGQRFELETLRGVLSRPNYEPTSLVDAQFVHQERDDYLFNHGLIKDAVVGTLLRTNRRRMHKNAAAWFEDRDLGLWAFHLEQAEDPSSSEAYETAAQAEALRFRFEQAVGFIDRAIALNDEANRGSRLEHLRGGYLLGIGATQQAVEAFTRSTTLGTEPELTCRGQIGLAHALRDLGEYERGIEVLKAAQGDAESAGLTRELAEIFHHRGNIKQLEVDAEGCREANTEALRYAREAGSPELEALALGGLARASVVSRHFKSEQRYALQCMEICRENGLEHIEFTFRHFAALTAFYSADVGTACKEFQACVERGPQVGALRPAIIANLTYAEMLLELGDTGQASQCLDESERLSNIIGEPRYSPCIQALRARIAWSSGNLESASSLVENALLEVSAADERWGKLYLLGALARLTNSPETRLAALEEGAQICSGPCWGIGAVRFLWDAMNASIAAKEWQHANSHAEALERFSRDEPMELFDLLIARTRALANRGLGSETISTGESIEQIRRSIENLGLVDDSAAL